MLSWALAFFIIAVIAAIFGFTGTHGSSGKYAAVPPDGWSCPAAWTCKPAYPMPPEKGFVCPEGWSCVPPMNDVSEIGKILFIVFVILFLISLTAGLLRRP